MITYKLGEIVLIKFPFTDNLTFKKRPALIIKDTDDGDVIVCRITSKLYNTLYDIELKDWEQNVLKLPSVIRTHKISSLDKTIINAKLGEVSAATKAEIIKLIQKLYS